LSLIEKLVWWNEISSSFLSNSNFFCLSKNTRFEFLQFRVDGTEIYA
jgi:hypothetical protein